MTPIHTAKTRKEIGPLSSPAFALKSLTAQSQKSVAPRPFATFTLHNRGSVLLYILIVCSIIGLVTFELMNSHLLSARLSGLSLQTQQHTFQLKQLACLAQKSLAQLKVSPTSTQFRQLPGHYNKVGKRLFNLDEIHWVPPHVLHFTQQQAMIVEFIHQQTIGSAQNPVTVSYFRVSIRHDFDNTPARYAQYILASTRPRQLTSAQVTMLKKAGIRLGRLSFLVLP